MGYRSWNNYEQAAEEEYRRYFAALPWHRRLFLRLRQAAVLALIIGLPLLLIVRGLGLF